MECRYGEASVGDGVPGVPFRRGRCGHRPARVIPSQCSHWRGNPFPLCGVVRAPPPTSCAVTLRRGRRPRRPVSRGLILPCRGGRLCPPCMTAVPCRAGPVCPAVTGEGIRLSSPPSARAVSARNADGGRDHALFSPPVGCTDSPLPEGA